MDRFKLYSFLFEAYVEAFSTKSKKLCQQEVNEKWNAIKDSEALIVKVDGLLNELVKGHHNETPRRFVEFLGETANPEIRSSY